MCTNPNGCDCNSCRDCSGYYWWRNSSENK